MPKFLEQDRVIAFNIDLLHPGIYLWALGFTLRIGGHLPDDTPYCYPGRLNSRFGAAIVLPNGWLWCSDRKTLE